jgi:hypothetical protein
MQAVRGLWASRSAWLESPATAVRLIRGTKAGLSTAEMALADATTTESSNLQRLLSGFGVVRHRVARFSPSGIDGPGSEEKDRFHDSRAPAAPFEANAAHCCRIPKQWHRIKKL